MNINYKSLLSNRRPLKSNSVYLTVILDLNGMSETTRCSAICHKTQDVSSFLLGLPACTHSDAQHHKRKIFTKFVTSLLKIIETAVMLASCVLFFLALSLLT